jgi:hypothetical protein
MDKNDALALLDVARMQTVHRPPMPDVDRIMRLLVAVIASMPSEADAAG